MGRPLPPAWKSLQERPRRSVCCCRPDVEIEPNLIRKASEEHRKLKTAYDALLAPRDKELEDRVLKRAAELLYIVRSNIVHGEKTPYGPDSRKKQRDEQVSIVVLPVQLMLFDILLDCPSQKLFTYGTLAPGKPNHHILSGLKGHWEHCTTSGELTEVNGLPVLRWELPGPSLQGQLLTRVI